MIDPELAARVLAEKNRLDPPSDGKEWSLGWHEDGTRAPSRDRLVSVEQTQDFGLYLGDGTPEGYDHPAAGPSIRSGLVDAVLFALAELDAAWMADPGRHEVAEAGVAAARVLAQVDGAHVFEVRNLARIAATAVAQRLSEGLTPRVQGGRISLRPH